VSLVSPLAQEDARAQAQQMWHVGITSKVRWLLYELGCYQGRTTVINGFEIGNQRFENYKRRDAN
jgi:hypothetical protein